MAREGGKKTFASRTSVAMSDEERDVSVDGKEGIIPVSVSISSTLQP
jgi:hypothetical protein